MDDPANCGGFDDHQFGVVGVAPLVVVFPSGVAKRVIIGAVEQVQRRDTKTPPSGLPCQADRKPYPFRKRNLSSRRLRTQSNRAKLVLLNSS